MKKQYTDEELINDINRFVIEYGKVPRQRDMCTNRGYIVYQQYLNRYGCWNNALLAANLKLHMFWHSEDDECSICHTKVTRDWSRDEHNNLICNNCNVSERHFIKGTLNPDSYPGIGVITEYVVSKVLNDCIKCNNENGFHSKIDLISNKYGTVDVKSSTLKVVIKNGASWTFIKTDTIYKPNCYICIGFNETRSRILRVWIIPNNANIIAKTCISVSLNKLERAIQYEVDATPYNKVYQNINIYSLPEFCNLSREVGEINA